MDLLSAGEIELDKAKAITNIAQAIIGTAKVEVDFIRAVGGISTGTGFIPLEVKSIESRESESKEEKE